MDTISLVFSKINYLLYYLCNKVLRSSNKEFENFIDGNEDEENQTVINKLESDVNIMIENLGENEQNLQPFSVQSDEIFDLNSEQIGQIDVSMEPQVSPSLRRSLRLLSKSLSQVQLSKSDNKQQLKSVVQKRKKPKRIASSLSLFAAKANLPKNRKRGGIIKNTKRGSTKSNGKR